MFIIGRRKIKMTNQKNMKTDYDIALETAPVIPISGDPNASTHLGVLLQQKRESLNIEISTVAETLCIRESFLMALEKGDYTVFPALVYAAGFLRSYASYLGMDVKPLMVKFRKETEHLKEDMAEIPAVVSKNVIPTRKFLFLLFLLIISVFCFVSYCSKKEIPPVQEQKTASELLEDKTPLVEEAPVSSDDLVANVQKTDVEKQDVTALSAELKALVPVQKDEGSNLFSGEKYGVKEGNRVSVLATDKVWIEVKNNNEVVFSKVLNKGDSYNPPLDAVDYELRTGNAGALSVYVDGEFKKVLGKKGHVLKNVLLTVSEYEK